MASTSATQQGLQRGRKVRSIWGFLSSEVSSFEHRTVRIQRCSWWRQASGSSSVSTPSFRKVSALTFFFLFSERFCITSTFLVYSLCLDCCL